MPGQPGQQQAARLMFVLFLFWILLPDGENRSQSFMLSDVTSARLKRFHGALDVMNTTSFGDFTPSNETEGKYVNLTGFREEDGFAWEDLGRFREKGIQLSHHAFPPTGGRHLWDTAEADPVWSSAEGKFHGTWVRKEGSVPRTYDNYNLSAAVPSLDWINDKVNWARNSTGSAGKIMLQIDSNKTTAEYEPLPIDRAPLAGGLVRNVKGSISIEDTTDSETSWDMRLWGVHWPRQGVVMMTTTSEKFDGIFGLPHLTPSADFFKSSQMLLNQTLAQTIAKKEKNAAFDSYVPWSSDVDNPSYTQYPAPHCEFVMYAQLHPPARQELPPPISDNLGEVLSDAIDAIESELDHPVGAPIGHIPKLVMSAVIYSPDCGFFLDTKGPPDFPPGEANHMTGLKQEVHVHYVKSWILVYTLVIFGQIVLLRDQLRESSTPSTTARVSFWTMAIMVLVDGMTFMAAAVWTSSAEATFLPTMAIVFAAFMSAMTSGLFLAKIHEVQIPERRPQRTRGPAAGETSSTNTSTTPVQNESNVGGSLLPAPVTAGRATQAPEQPIIVPSDQDVDAEIAEVTNAASAVPRAQGQATDQSAPPESFQNVLGKLILFTLFISFILVSSSTWYPSLRSIFLNSCAFAYFSLWLPQIYRNAMRNCRRALRWQFVVGQSALRLLPAAYFWVKEDNILYTRTEPRAFALLCLWVWIQILVLIAQDVLGPRFGLPPDWLPEAWDYHPILREDSLEGAGLPIGLAVDETSDARTSEERKRSNDTTRSIDCAICHEVLEVSVIKAGDDSASSVTSTLARRMYMVTPCRHIFHTACLEGWMRFRLQCPICREELPPL